MCFDHDSRPPIAPIAGGALDSTLVDPDRGRRQPVRGLPGAAAGPRGAGVVILPDVRGLHPYYEELALRFAERGIDAWPSTGSGGRPAPSAATDFEYMPHVDADDVGRDPGRHRRRGRRIRRGDGPRPACVFTIGFCMGGRMSFLAATLGLDLAGVIGMYGRSSGRGATTRRRRSTWPVGSRPRSWACSAARTGASPRRPSPRSTTG